jgi:hypothetical protein
VGTTPGLDAMEKKKITCRLTGLEGVASWNILLGQLKIWNT